MNERPTFQYLKSKDGHIGMLNVIPESGQIIIRDESRLCYTYWPTTEAEKLYNVIVSDSKSFHEVILGNVNQKIRLDIDIDTSSKEFTSFVIPEITFIEHKLALWHKLQPPRPTKCPTCGSALNQKCKCRRCDITVPFTENSLSIEEIKTLYILKRICEAYKCVMREYVYYTPDYVLCSSCRKGKYSFHLISTAYTIDSYGANEIANRIHDEIPESVRVFNDIAVSAKGGHNLRMCLCIKPQRPDTRKHIIKGLFDNEIQFLSPVPKAPSYDEWKETLVTYITEMDILISCAYKPSESLAYDSMDSLPKDIVDKVTKLFEGVSEAGREGKRYIFMRYASGFCPICKRVHDSDNMFVFMAYGHYFARCWRNSTKLKI